MFSLDHIVHLAKDKVSAQKQFHQEGFTVFPGGKHDTWGTSNFLSYFGPSYIEFISVDEQEKVRVSDNPLIQLVHKNNRRNGIIQTAIRTDHIEGDAVTFSKLGLHVTGPIEGTRITEQGKRLSWKMLFVRSERSSFELPFFIEWNQTVPERLQDLTDSGVQLEHQNGAQAVKNVYYAVKNIDNVYTHWKKWFNCKKIKSYANDQWNAICTEIKLGEAFFTFFEPKGEGPVKTILQENGEGPFGAELICKGSSGHTLLIDGGYYSVISPDNPA
ncbi:VOC family protein [Peribacillus kribbensis]|uniref:VOC family protein n=1 Tax=Peribacillus kribbensis TaxID=356658 RepID=UPI000428FCED|nr:VOC family protein [Peribacillus kribbensis]